MNEDDEFIGGMVFAIAAFLIAFIIAMGACDNQRQHKNMYKRILIRAGVAHYETDVNGNAIFMVKTEFTDEGDK